MATEPLGGRILWAATNWEAIRAEDGVMAGREEYEDLRALCARADAAERLAVATVDHERYWNAYQDAVRVGADRDAVDAFCSVAILASAELNAARDSWLAITQGVGKADLHAWRDASRSLPLCPVCGGPTNPKPYGPFFTPDPVYRWADTCPLGDYRGPLRATIAAATFAVDANATEAVLATLEAQAAAAATAAGGE
jgi:hypothetical protein